MTPTILERQREGRTKVWLEINRADGSTEKRAIDPRGHVGIARGACPGCGADPFCVVGHGRHRQGHDTYKAAGRCKRCGDPVGYIFARVDTLFGIEEDEAVGARARVYA